jgi:perosamine synthetase
LNATISSANGVVVKPNDTNLFKSPGDLDKMDFIPVSMPLLDGNEKKYLNECVDSGWISSEGPFVKRFEQEFSKLSGRKHGIAVCNGSTALDLALAALEIGHGDEVILPTFTIISCSAAVVRAGAKPVLVDCNPWTWNMDVERIEEKISCRTKAIMAVHTYGLPVDMDPVFALCQRYGLKIIEDAAEAHFLKYKGKLCGSLGDISTFSFYPNKLITTGEGGMLLTDDDDIAERCRSFRNLCFQPNRRFVHEKLGWNFRMSNIQAALGVAQLERVSFLVKRKKYIGQRYTSLLKDIKNIQLPLTETIYAKNNYWVYGILIKENAGLNAKEAMKQLAESKIGTRPFFWPMHKQPVFQKMHLFHGVSCPVSENLSINGFYIPSGLALSETEIEFVAQKIHQIFTN